MILSNRELNDPMIIPTWMSEDDSSNDTVECILLPSDDEMEEDELIRGKSARKRLNRITSSSSLDGTMSDSSTSSESMTDELKWCVCQNSHKTIDNLTKMCTVCSQWYHLTCLNLSNKVIDYLCQKVNADQFMCPVCEDDRVFVKKYNEQIKLRNKFGGQFFSITNRYRSSNSESSSSELSSVPPTSELSSAPSLQSSLFTSEEEESLSKHSSRKIPSEMTAAEQNERIEHLKRKKMPTKQIKVIDPNIRSKPRSSSSHLTAPTKQIKNIKRSIMDHVTSNPMKSMSCVSCSVKLSLKRTEIVPKSINEKYPRNSKLAHNWQDSVFCDPRCIHDHVESVMQRIQNRQITSVVLFESKTQVLKKKFSSENLPSHQELKEFLEIHPNCYVRNSGASERSQSSSTKRFNEASKPPVHRKPAKRPNELQEKSIEMLTKELRIRSSQDNDIQPINIVELSEKIELAVRMSYEGDRYKNKIRQIVFAVKDLKNETFYLNILNGKIQPEQLAKMKSTDMASETRKAERAENLNNDIEGHKKNSEERNYFLKKYCDDRVESRNLKSTISSMENPIVTENEVPLAPVPDTPRPTNSENLATKELTPETIKIPKNVINTTVDTTKDHANHLMDVNCKICIGQKSRIEITPIKPPVTATLENEAPATISKQITQDLEFNKPLDYISSNSMNREAPSEIAPSPESLPRTSSTVVNTPSPRMGIEDELELTTLENCSTYIPPVSPFKQQMPEKIWTGKLHTEDDFKKIISVNAVLMPKLPPHCDINKKFLKKAKHLPHDFKHLETFSFVGKNSNSTFWKYLDHLNEVHKAQFTFLKINSNGTPNGSQMFIPNKEKPNFVDDDDMYALVYDHLLKRQRVYELSVPQCLTEDFGQMFIISLAKKPLELADLNLKKKYSVLVTRPEDQLLAILISSDAVRAYNSIDHIKVWKLNGEESTRLTPPEHLLNQKKPAAIIAAKRKSDEHRNEDSNVKKNKPTIKPPEVHKVDVPAPKSTQLRDPRLEKVSQNRDPRIKQPEQTGKPIEKVNTESSFYNLDNVFARLMLQDREYDPTELIGATENIIKKNINTKNQFTQAEKAEIRKKWEPMFSKYMYLLDIDKDSSKSSVQKNDENLPDPSKWQGESLSSFNVLEKLHLDPVKLQRLSFQNVNWNLPAKHFDRSHMFNKNSNDLSSKLPPKRLESDINKFLTYMN